jgi:hypothetical protein
MDSQSSNAHRMPPTVALGLLGAQRAARSLTRDSANKQIGYDYTSADQITEAARVLLNAQGLFFTKLKFKPVARSHDTDGDIDIGNQYYAGDVEITYAIVHAESGDMLVETSTIPIVVAKARPHDKGLAASVTYATGQILMGLLCLDREDRNDRERNVDSRHEDMGERSAKPPTKPRGPRANKSPQAPADVVPPDVEMQRDPLGARCNGKAAGISKSIGERMRTMVETRGGKAADVWADVLAEAGIDVSKYGRVPRSEALTIPDGTAVRDYLIRVLEAPADMDALRSQAGKLWVRIVQGPDGLKLDDWKAEWAGFAQIERWPDQPSAADLQHTIAGMTLALERMNS